MKQQKSKKHRRISVRTPGGKNKILYKKKKPAKAQCARCGATLKGVPTDRVYKMKRIPKTKKRPERPYGGVLCSKCTRDLMTEKALSMYKEVKEEEK